MNNRLIAQLNNLTINEKLTKGIKIFNNYRLTNSFEVFSNDIADDAMVFSIGSLEYQSFESSCYVYAFIDDSFNIYEHEERIKMISQLLKICRSLSTAIWLIKDNSVNVETGYLYTPTNDMVSSNRIDPYYYSHKCEVIDITLSREEIHKCIHLIKILYGFDNIFNTDITSKEYMAFSQISKLSRAFAFISLARSQFLIPMKITLYMTALESILSNSNTEITNQISQNVAHILGDSKEDKISISRLIKKGYDVRSCCIHGNNLSNKYKDAESLFELSRQIDDTVRNVILYIMGNEDLFSIFNNENPVLINDWIENLPFKV